MRPLIVSILAVLTALFCYQPAQAQFVKRLKDRAKERVEENVGRKVDKAVDNVMNGEVGSEPASESPSTPRTPADDSADREQKDVAGQVEAAGLQPGQGLWDNYDFIPGERVLFAEDFTKDRVGNFPQRFEMLTGNADVVEWNGRRWMRALEYSVIKIPLPESLPERFTVEFELTVPWSRMGFYAEEKEDYTNSSQYIPTYQETSSVEICGTETAVHRGGNKGRSGMDPRDYFKGMFDDNAASDHLSTRPYHVRMAVDGAYIKLYLDEKRVANLPNGNFGRTSFLVFEFDHNGEEKDAPLITGFSINAGGTPMYDALMTDGRVSMQGILFDTGSDRIQPESTPTLKEIGAMLTAHADLRLSIEGHTDNVGSAEGNQALSEKRAAAVRTFLVDTYGIDRDRLESRGFGASTPAASNDTPEGRRQNRRVELVRL